jgi:methionine sulfoxide reductase catalytic subunit
MLIKKPSDLLSSDITPRDVYARRREFLRQATALGLAGSMLPAGRAAGQTAAPVTEQGKLPKLPGKASTFSVTEKATPYKDVVTYNNYYEFGTDKSQPAENAHKLKTRPWSVAIDGEVKNKKPIDMEELLKLAPMEERIYRMRCVEGWSMVIPWVGYPLAELIKRAEPTSKAKFVAFTTATQPENMIGLRLPVLEWPYAEGLRIDEAMHPLAILAFGLYGEVLPNQNGAPVRLVVPWKYGFKGIKSIVRITFTETMPKTSWNVASAHEYGFYSNVNPAVDHPRWSQATERRIGEDGFFQPKRKTLMFNGYGDQVAKLYAGMDLKKFF